jgi:hypothetical protein
VLGDDPEVSSIFTPLTITINVDAFESIEFDLSEPGNLRYVLRSGADAVEIEYQAGTQVPDAAPVKSWLEYRGEQYVQMHRAVDDCELLRECWFSGKGKE